MYVLLCCLVTLVLVLPGYLRFAIVWLPWFCCCLVTFVLLLPGCLSFAGLRKFGKVEVETFSWSLPIQAVHTYIVKCAELSLGVEGKYHLPPPIPHRHCLFMYTSRWLKGTLTIVYSSSFVAQKILSSNFGTWTQRLVSTHWLGTDLK